MKYFRMIKNLMERYRAQSREKKYKLFLEKIQPKDNDTILDIGGGNGLFLEQKYQHKSNIICLDLELEPLLVTKEKYPEIQCILADATALPIKDSSVPIVFSNAVIEHVGNRENQKQYANEILRVAKKFFVTTPNKFFPIEFHYRIPFYQFIPKIIQRWLNNKFSVGLWYNKGIWEDIYLLSYRQLKKLFSKNTVIKLNTTFISESLICYKD